MLEKLNSKTATAVATVKKHRAKIAVVTTLGVVIYVDRARVKQWNQFLLDNNLYEAFYAVAE